MIYKLHLYLLMLMQPCCIQAEEEIAGKTNIGEENPYFPLREHREAISAAKNTYTAGNTKCKYGTSCEYYESGKYSYCYTEYTWDFCCTGPCEISDSRTFMYCPTGELSTICGSSGNRTVDGKTCIESHPCGIHETDKSFLDTYWCRTDNNHWWEHCCNPLDPCRDRGDGYGNWCYTGLIIGTGNKWEYCIP
ncbi:hypothetical protein CHS0354_019558 [Potamilus streckersoni]|uniref:Uncharacterized protein n=1 Tax=Potamilus streckersoni TaxID=2493646 RepID=A0AAE0TFP2_9BIVA|nr:hypothetical protein CHS0354_019558 [Potamilus streckersoni]